MKYSLETLVLNPWPTGVGEFGRGEESLGDGALLEVATRSVSGDVSCPGAFLYFLYGPCLS